MNLRGGDFFENANANFKHVVAFTSSVAGQGECDLKRVRHLLHLFETWCRSALRRRPQGLREILFCAKRIRRCWSHWFYNIPCNLHQTWLGKSFMASSATRRNHCGRVRSRTASRADDAVFHRSCWDLSHEPGAAFAKPIASVVAEAEALVNFIVLCIRARKCLKTAPKKHHTNRNNNTYKHYACRCFCCSVCVIMTPEPPPAIARC